MTDRRTLLFLLAGAFAGCSADEGARDADHQGAGGMPDLTGARPSTGGVGSRGVSGGGAGLSGTGATPSSGGAGGFSTAGSGGNLGSGGAPPEPQSSCPAGSTLRVSDTDAGYAEYGSVFSSTKYEYDVAGSHKPKALVVTVDQGGSPVADCEVRFETEPGHGWVFPHDTLTDSKGMIRAFWTAGDQANQFAIARMLVDGEPEQTVTFSGVATPSPRTRTNSVHIYYEVPGTWSEIKVRVTPQSGPQSTYYSTVNWPGAYGGVQFDENDEGTLKTTKVLFSVWDVNAGAKAELIDDGVCNETVDFGGEGTGTSCRLIFPPSEHGPIAGLPDDYMLRAGDTYETHVSLSSVSGCATCTDYTFWFLDVTRGLGPLSLGTQRYKAAVSPTSASGFIEDWWDAPGDHCLNSGARTAYFHDITAKVGGTWMPITQATFSPNYVPGNHEICANYFFTTSGDRFLMSSGGTELVSAPRIQGDPDFGNSLTANLENP